jgi:gliding motility-associated-like protein
MRLHLIALLTFGVSLVAYSQVPVIQNVAPLNTFNNDTIVVTGSGFSSTPANLDVWFGAVKGTIISSTDFAIEVKVPAQATLSNIRVVNKTSFTSATSDLKFMPSLKTEPFDPAKFAAPLSFTAQQELWDLCLCDLNIDGKPDVASTKFARSSGPYLASQDIMILQNNSTPGAMAFSKIDRNNLAALNLGYATDNIVCGDLNGDGKPELIASRGSDPRNSIVIFRNTTVGGAGSAITFAAPTGAGANPTILFLDVGHAATRIQLRDLNKDGKPEIIVTASTTDFIYIFTNTSSAGTISFAATPIKVDIDLATTNLRTYEAEVQDFDGDGLADIVVNRFQDNNIYILRNTSTSSIGFAAPAELTTPAERDFNRIQSADFNNDGKLDLVFTTSVVISQISAVYLNTSSVGAISFTPDASAIKITTSVGAWGIDVGDIDGDKDPDMVIASRDMNELNIFLHNGNFTTPNFTKVLLPTTTPTVWNTRNIKAGDLDGDGKTDLVYTAFRDATGTTSVEILRNTHCHQPEIQNLEPLTICNGQTIILETINANNVTYEWKKDGVVIGTNSPYLTITAGGTYRVTATNGACALFDEIVVTTNASATPSEPLISSNSPICVSGTLTFSTPQVGAETYTWTKPDGSTLTGANQSLVATLDDAGFYKVQATLGPCKSEVVTKRLDVANLANFAIASNPTTNLVCAGGTVQLSVSNLANHTYQWEKNGADISGSTTNLLAANSEGAYTVRVKNTTLNCETETSAVTVSILTAPVANFTADATACVGEELTFTNTSTVDSRATVNYTWNFGDASGSTLTSPTKTYNAPQNYTVNLNISYTGVTGCTGTIGKQLLVSSSVLPIIVSEDPSLCPDEETNLSIAGTFASVLWDNTATTNTISVTGPGTYTVQTTDANGCPGDDTITIGAKTVPTLTLTATPQTIPAGATSQLVAEIPENGTKTYLWTPAETLSSATISNPIATPTLTTLYTVIGTIEGGCSATGEIEVTVAGTLGFPAAFSPNNDGIADTWDIRAQDKPECVLSVFDTRGRRVFEAKGENWDGTYQGKPVPVGTYYYVFGCPSEKAITGSVLIMK